ncbi:hypothetical protein B0T21DRAFT_193615 [Apiosordaria backusii]|uniref:Uncharacterized protein n=1 Tax=Apiosordaria backusii TaxID=314023 RepID=A0AA40BKF8_9PEZI|nr:hypothetical protein B0T21DRAFT_193615 [Apiosordaria backusii]
MIFGVGLLIGTTGADPLLTFFRGISLLFTQPDILYVIFGYAYGNSKCLGEDNDVLLEALTVSFGSPQIGISFVPFKPPNPPPPPPQLTNSTARI